MRVRAQAPRFFVIYDSQFPLASSRFGRDSIQYRAGTTQCQGHQDPSKRVPIFLGGTEANLKMVPIGPVPISRLRTVRRLAWAAVGTSRIRRLNYVLAAMPETQTGSFAVPTQLGGFQTSCPALISK